MKIISWNVNGIRAVAKKWFSNFINDKNPDILCIQETKAFEEQFLKEVWEIEWYNYVWHAWTRPWYAGTAIFYKKDLKVIDYKKHFDEIEHFYSDWRVTELEFELDWTAIVLFNWYFPNWWQKVTEENMLDYKLEFYDHVINYSNKIKANWKNIILTWDFNICHTEIDIAKPKDNQNSIWFLPIERSKISELINNWYVDVWRKLNPSKTNVYSWWSYRAWARPRNIGWRLDYFMVNDNFIDKVKDMSYLTNVMGSDHCPIELIIK